MLVASWPSLLFVMRIKLAPNTNEARMAVNPQVIQRAPKSKPALAVVTIPAIKVSAAAAPIPVLP